MHISLASYVIQIVYTALLKLWIRPWKCFTFINFKRQFGLRVNNLDGNKMYNLLYMIRQKHQVVDKNKAARLSHGNPIGAEGNHLHNFFLKNNNTTKTCYEDYVVECTNGDTSHWAPVKKQNNKMCMS